MFYYDSLQIGRHLWLEGDNYWCCTCPFRNFRAYCEGPRPLLFTSPLAAWLPILPASGPGETHPPWVFLGWSLVCRPCLVLEGTSSRISLGRTMAWAWRTWKARAWSLGSPRWRTTRLSPSAWWVSYSIAFYCPAFYYGNFKIVSKDKRIDNEPHVLIMQLQQWSVCSHSIVPAPPPPLLWSIFKWTRFTSCPL